MSPFSGSGPVMRVTLTRVELTSTGSPCLSWHTLTVAAHSLAAAISSGPAYVIVHLSQYTTTPAVNKFVRRATARLDPSDRRRCDCSGHCANSGTSHRQQANP